MKLPVVPTTEKCGLEEFLGFLGKTKIKAYTKLTILM